MFWGYPHFRKARHVKEGVLCLQIWVCTAENLSEHTGIFYSQRKVDNTQSGQLSNESDLSKDVSIPCFFQSYSQDFADFGNGKAMIGSQAF